MDAVLIRREVVADKAYAAVDLDHPGGQALAVAWLGKNGWSVGTVDGLTVAEGLTKTRALNVMHHTATAQLDHAVVRSLLAEAQ